MLHGFDLSYAQAGLSLAEIADKAGFLLLRAGYGGDYTDQDDSEFDRFVEEADALGIPWGAYLYSYALSLDNADSEVAHMKRLLKGKKPALGVWFDMEDADGYKKRNGMPSNSMLVDICERFCSDMEKAGYYVGIYASLSWLENQLKSSKLDKYDKWVAQWNKTCDYKGGYSIWQYTDTYEIAGRKLDANWLVRDFRDEAISPETKPEDSKPAQVNKNSRVLATGSNQITQHYGNAGHGGCDLVKKTNQLDAITAHSDGTVVWCQSGIPNDQGSSGNRSYGNAVKLRHANGWYTLYAHMDYISVENGQMVKKGQKIGYMGNTGNSYGAHLHFEVRDKSDARVNPEPYLNADLPKDSTSNSASGSTTGYTGDITYRAYVNGKWLSSIVNYGEGSNGYAGIYGSSIQGLKIDAKNCDVYYRAHLKSGEWLPEVKNSGSGSNGYAGIYGKDIDGVQIRVPQGHVDCRVHIKGGDWLDWVQFKNKYQSGANGYAGIYGKSIDGIQMA